jgi:hypothetical protein
MVTSDPARTPTFTEFADPNYFLSTGAASCDPTDAGATPCTKSEGHGGFAWNHGDVTPDIVTTWLGMVGPGVRIAGVNGSVWTDHADIRPTLMALTGLKDDYTHDGRVITEIMSPPPKALRPHLGTLMRLGQIYKEINAPVGPLSLASLKIAYDAAASGSATDDSTYTSLDQQLAQITATRDSLAGQMRSMLEGAAFNGQMIDEQQAQSLIAQGQALLSQVQTLANHS